MSEQLNAKQNDSAVYSLYEYKFTDSECGCSVLGLLPPAITTYMYTSVFA